MNHKKLQILALSLHFLQCKYPWKSSYTYFPLKKLYLIIHSMTREMLDLSNVTHHQCNSCSYTHIYLLQIVWLGDNFMIQTFISVSAKYWFNYLFKYWNIDVLLLWISLLISTAKTSGLDWYHSEKGNLRTVCMLWDWFPFFDNSTILSRDNCNSYFEFIL